MYGDPIKVKIDVGGFQNLEPIIYDTVREEKYRSLNSIKKLDDKTIELDFSELNFQYIQKRKITQFSKKKYKSEIEVVEKIKEEKNKKSALNEPLWREIQVIELPRVWLAFCKR